MRVRCHEAAQISGPGCNRAMDKHEVRCSMCHADTRMHAHAPHAHGNGSGPIPASRPAPALSCRHDRCHSYPCAPCYVLQTRHPTHSCPTAAAPSPHPVERPQLRGVAASCQVALGVVGPCWGLGDPVAACQVVLQQQQQQVESSAPQPESETYLLQFLPGPTC